jgi:peroxiredoxin Q/BCP
MKALVLVALAVGLAGGSPALAQDVKKDAEQLRGRWWAVGALDADGKVSKIGQDDPRHFVVSFGADKPTAALLLRKRTINGTYQLDPSKNPKEIDIAWRDGDKERTFKGIYAIEEDRLKICLAATGNERPRGFQSAKGVPFAAVFGQLKVGRPAPPFTAETTDGKKIALADFRNKSVVLLVFYSNQYDGSESALRRVKEIHDKYRNKGFEVLAAPQEAKRDDAAFFGKHLKAGFPTLFDPKSKIADAYGVDSSAPAGPNAYVVLIGRDGKVVARGAFIDDTDIVPLGEFPSREAPLEEAVKELTEKK